MIGAIAGDIIGSRWEFNRIKTTDFPLFSEMNGFTDDSIMTAAIADAILHDKDPAESMREWFRKIRPRKSVGGYGKRFFQWLAAREVQPPYNSFGNGAAMRISPVGFYYDTLEEVLAKAEYYTAVTHSHPEGIKGAQATAAAIFLARNGASKDDIRRYVTEAFGYDLNRTCDQIRPDYTFDVTCQGSVPEAIICFLESTDFESAVRLAVSLGGDSDTLACITGGIAEGFYGVPQWIEEKAMTYLDLDLKVVVKHGFYRALRNKHRLDLSTRSEITPAELRQAIAQWEESVEWISHGYDPYEYDNDLSYREGLDIMLARYCTTKTLQAADAESLQAIDDRFRQATVETEQCVLTDGKGNPDSIHKGHIGLTLPQIKKKYWYYFRWPPDFGEYYEKDDCE